MRIIELLEGNNFKDLDFVKPVGDEGNREINFDLIEDLIFFMNNDDEAYRRHLHPAISNCIDRTEAKKKTSSKMFEKAIRACYTMYNKQYPIREIPDTLDEEVCKEACEKLHEEVCQHIKDGKYE
jgi:hypothetical protein